MSGINSKSDKTEIPISLYFNGGDSVIETTLAELVEKYHTDGVVYIFNECKIPTIGTPVSLDKEGKKVLQEFIEDTAKNTSSKGGRKESDGR